MSFLGRDVVNTQSFIILSVLSWSNTPAMGIWVCRGMHLDHYRRLEQYADKSLRDEGINGREAGELRSFDYKLN